MSTDTFEQMKKEQKLIEAIENTEAVIKGNTIKVQGADGTVWIVNVVPEKFKEKGTKTSWSNIVISGPDGMPLIEFPHEWALIGNLPLDEHDPSELIRIHFEGLGPVEGLCKLLRMMKEDDNIWKFYYRSHLENKYWSEGKFAEHQTLEDFYTSFKICNYGKSEMHHIPDWILLHDAFDWKTEVPKEWLELFNMINNNNNISIEEDRLRITNNKGVEYIISIPIMTEDKGEFTSPEFPFKLIQPDVDYPEDLAWEEWLWKLAKMEYPQAILKMIEIIQNQKQISGEINAHCKVILDKRIWWEENWPGGRPEDFEYQ